MHSDIYIFVTIGVVLSLIYAETTGMLPAGLVVPGYLAMFFRQPLLLLIIFLVSTVTYLIVIYGISKYTILYGRRMFAAMLLVAIIVKTGLDFAYPALPWALPAITGLGVIVPGLIANTTRKQGILYTYSSTLLLTTITFGTVTLYFRWFVK